MILNEKVFLYTKYQQNRNVCYSQTLRGISSQFDSIQWWNFQNSFLFLNILGSLKSIFCLRFPTAMIRGVVPSPFLFWESWSAVAPWGFFLFLLLILFLRRIPRQEDKMVTSTRTRRTGIGKSGRWWTSLGVAWWQKSLSGQAWRRWKETIMQS